MVGGADFVTQLHKKILDDNLNVMEREESTDLGTVHRRAEPNSNERLLMLEPGLHGTDGETIESEGSMRPAMEIGSMEAEMDIDVVDYTSLKSQSL